MSAVVGIFYLVMVWHIVSVTKTPAQEQYERWQRMCHGGARYQAMREAFDLHQANPCRQRR